MSDRDMSGEKSEHPEGWRISALLDEPEGDPAAAAHLEACEACAAEYEQMSRARMALSGLGELDPPADEWERIEVRLDALEAAGEAPFGAPAHPDGGPDPAAAPFRRGLRRFLASWPLQAAAALALFAGGVLAGLQLTSGVGGPAAVPSELAAGDRPAEPGTTVPAATGPEGAFALEEWPELEELRSLMGPEAATAPAEGLEPSEAAERLARLDALILASRQALDRAPADPVANGLLFELVERRNRLASELGESLHLANVEYR